MGGASPDPGDLGADGLDRLREYFSERFKGDPTLKRAITSVLDDLSDDWANASNGLDPTSWDLLRGELAPRLRSLMGVPTTDAKAQCDQLVAAWGDLRRRLIWS
jgi:hypothetical protein